jgi:hypothetical protein
MNFIPKFWDVTLSFLEAPKGFIHRADIHRKRMVWPEIDGRKRYNLVN